ncbi:MAG: hypothetical protein WKI04_05895 [Ferruginibacter sp.]
MFIQAGGPSIDCANGLNSVERHLHPLRMGHFIEDLVQKYPAVFPIDFHRVFLINDKFQEDRPAFNRFYLPPLAAGLHFVQKAP